MAKEHFTIPGSKDLIKLIEAACGHGRLSRDRAFGDFLEIAICVLSGERMEERYLEVIKPYVEGDRGKRGIDRMADAFALLWRLTKESSKDVIGDVFMGAITYGEHGQFYTPENICDLMARMTTEVADTGDVQAVTDPCCGSGRMLLAAGKINPHWIFYGTDIDIRCVRMTAINLAFAGLRGFVTHGNELTNERHLTYRVGFDGVGLISLVSPENFNGTQRSDDSERASVHHDDCASQQGSVHEVGTAVLQHVSQETDAVVEPSNRL